MKQVCDKYGSVLVLVLGTKDYIQQKDKRFFSASGDILQIGSLFFPRNSIVAPHIHQHKEHTADSMEVLLLFDGRMEADIYDEEHQLVESLKLKPGDILIQKRGGHGFRFPVKATLLEIKLGPYDGRDSDKEMI